MRELQRCRKCGTRPDEWSPEAGGDLDAYVAVVRRCRGCEVLEAEHERHRDKPLGGGVYIAMQRRR